MPKQATAETPAADAEDSADATDRLLALVVPGKQQAWFFKLVGSVDQVAPVADAVTAFFGSVEIGESGPEWKLPGDWSESPPAGMRRATITVVDGLEMSVIGLPLTGDWNAQLLDNVNRWRGQMALASTGAPGLAASTTPIEGLPDGVLVDLRGKFSSGGMTPPFAGGGASRPVAPPTRPAAPPAEIAFDTPDGWVDQGATSMRKANFKTGDGGDAADVRAMSFAAFGQMASPLANVNRWRGQVGLPEVDANQVMQLAQPVKIAGEAAVLFEMAPDESSTTPGDPMAITAAMSKRGEQVWFFMMSGPPATVAAERSRFDEWLASVTFMDDPAGGDEEATDGDG